MWQRRHGRAARGNARRVDSNEAPVLQRRASLSVGQSLALRAGLALGLMAIALGGHWLARDGLRDNIDGSITFIDVLYFTTVTVTTVGYGDIVPVTPSARLFDAVVVTPIRLFIWLIFLGTAYTFVLQRTWEQRRTRLIARSLRDHYIVCGFGAGGSAAVTELLRQGVPAPSIVVIDQCAERVSQAIELGVTAMHADATRNATLDQACVACAGAVLVSMGRDDTVALVVLSARKLNAEVPIIASVRLVENEDLLRQAGASSIINPVSLGGHLLARASTNRGAVDYIRDLAAADGRVQLQERPSRPDETGQSLASINSGLGVRILRDDRPIGFWEAAATAIEPGDRIIEIVPVRDATSPAQP